MQATAKYPATIWSGLTTNRSQLSDNVGPNYMDWDQIVAEIIALETALGAVATPPAKGTDPSALIFGGQFQITIKDILLAVGASAVASVAVGYSIPAGSIVLGCAINIENAITLATATKICLGVAGTLDKYGVLAAVTKNTKSTKAITPTALATADTLILYATDNSDAAAGTIQNGSVRIHLTLGTQLALADA